MRRCCWGTFVLFLLLIGATVYGANVSVPLLELITHGTFSDGLFQLTTRGEMDLRIEGGYKFGGMINLYYLGTELEKGLLGTTDNSEFKGIYFARKISSTASLSSGSFSRARRLLSSISI